MNLIVLALPDCSIRVFQSLAGASETLLTFKDQCKLYAAILVFSPIDHMIFVDLVCQTADPPHL